LRGALEGALEGIGEGRKGGDHRRGWAKRSRFVLIQAMGKNAQVDFALLIVGVGLVIGGSVRLNSAMSVLRDLTSRMGVGLVRWSGVLLCLYANGLQEGLARAPVRNPASSNFAECEICPQESPAREGEAGRVGTPPCCCDLFTPLQDTMVRF
jgi:hypothetical protein